MEHQAGSQVLPWWGHTMVTLDTETVDSVNIWVLGRQVRGAQATVLSGGGTTTAQQWMT